MLLKTGRLNERGAILITSYAVVFTLLVLGGVFFNRTITDQKFFEMSRDRLEALYVAEAGVDRAIYELNNNFSVGSLPSSLIQVSGGEFEIANISGVPGSKIGVEVTAYIPNQASARATRIIQAIVKKETSPSFYDYAIYSADEVDLNGGSYSVTGDVVYGGSIDNPGNVTGTHSQDPSINPLATFDFQALYDLAALQGNLYDSDRLDDVGTGADSYPSDFWYTDPTDPTDPTTGVPNAVYVEGDMVLNGNIGTVGGFFIVVGNVLTDPDDTGATTLNGNGFIDGCVYTTGKFKLNGGGPGLNIDGGVWAGTEAELNGNADVTYNLDYMLSIEQMIADNNAGSAVQLVSWREV